MFSQRPAKNLHIHKTTIIIKTWSELKHDKVLMKVTFVTFSTETAADFYEFMLLTCEDI